MQTAPIHYGVLSFELRDSLLGEESRRVIAELETRFETEKKEREIAELSKQRAEDALKLSQQRNWMLILGAALFLTPLSGWYLYDRKRQQSATQLAEAEAAFSKKMLETNLVIQKEERQRIAKEIHDGLVQSIAALKLNIQRILTELGLSTEQRTTFKPHLQQLDEAAEEARTISHQMMPRALMESGLVSALEDMLNKTLGNAEFEFTFEHFGIGKKRFKPSIEVGLYRIAQELVNNIIKHSGAKHAVVQLYQTKYHLILHVEDDGAGFDIKQVKTASGIGLQNIFSRANAVNGEVSYEQAAPKGTAASIRIPLDQE